MVMLPIKKITPTMQRQDFFYFLASKYLNTEGCNFCFVK